MWTCSIIGALGLQPSIWARVKRFDNKYRPVKVGSPTNWVWWWWCRQWGWNEALLLWVWWHASLKMTKCKNCLEDLIKYVWNWVFKEGIDREIHHRIVKCRNTIKVWIFSIVSSCHCAECYRQENTENTILILHVTSKQSYFSSFGLNILIISTIPWSETFHWKQCLVLPNGFQINRSP